MRSRIAEQVIEGSVRMEDGRLQGQVVGSVVWGNPVPPLPDNRSMIK